METSYTVVVSHSQRKAEEEEEKLGSAELGAWRRADADETREESGREDEDEEEEDAREEVFQRQANREGP